MDDETLTKQLGEVLQDLCPLIYRHQILRDSFIRKAKELMLNIGPDERMPYIDIQTVKLLVDIFLSYEKALHYSALNSIEE